jgi:hypothetical protein
MIGLILSAVLISMPLVPPIVKDAQSLSDYMRAEFTYQNEEGDYWQTPEETAKLKTFDCEDASFYVEKVLTSLGYEVKAICIKGYIGSEKFVHAICVVKVEGGYRYFSNQYYSYFKTFSSITEIVEFECKDWRWYCEIYLPHNFQNFVHNVISGS